MFPHLLTYYLNTSSPQFHIRYPHLKCERDNMYKNECDINSSIELLDPKKISMAFIEEQVY